MEAGWDQALWSSWLLGLPRQAAQEAIGTLHVRTVADSLLVAVNAKHEVVWRYHGDHLRRWAAEHRKALERWADDSKYENRPLPTFGERRAAAARKFRDRMDSVTHEIAAQLASYAQRRKFAALEYDDRERSCPACPYYRLASLIAEKLDARGIAFVATSANGGPEEKTVESLANDEET